jgi:integrase
LALLVREAEKEAAKWREVEKTSRLTYEAKAKQLAEGWDLGTACKRSRYSMRAAGLWTMRKQLRAMLREAKRVEKNGRNGGEFFALREAQFAKEMEKVAEKLAAIRAFEGLPWAEIEDAGRRLEKSHKKSPAKDSELVSFYKSAEKSSYREAFLVAEFAGCRGEELGKGVRVEAGKKEGVSTLRFFVQSAKSDGQKKGLDLRAIEVPFPSGATEPVQRRWLELAKSVVTATKSTKKSHIVSVAASEKQTAGRLFTDACKNTARAAGVDVSAYSLRNRFSAQVKQANPGDAVAVAVALGHQTTETQRHYARASRGGGDVSPVQSIGVNVSGQAIRGDPTRSGPPLHVKQKAVFSAAVAAVPPPKIRGPRL